MLGVRTSSLNRQRSYIPIAATDKQTIPKPSTIISLVTTSPNNQVIGRQETASSIYRPTTETLVWAFKAASGPTNSNGPNNFFFTSTSHGHQILSLRVNYILPPTFGHIKNSYLVF